MFKSTAYIFNNPWSKALEDIAKNSPTTSLPEKEKWNKDTPMTINDVKLWEQIYYSAGDVGIYAAWDPYDELYIIVHNLFINTNFGIEVFSGNNAADDVWNRARELGIELNGLTPS